MVTHEFVKYGAVAEFRYVPVRLLAPFTVDSSGAFARRTAYYTLLLEASSRVSPSLSGVRPFFPSVSLSVFFPDASSATLLRRDRLLIF